MTDLLKVEANYKEVAANLGEIKDQLKAHAEQALKDVAAHKAMSEETRAKVDELLTTQGALQARLSAAEQLLADGGSSSKHQVMTMGQMVAASEEFAQNAGRLASAKGSFSVPVQAAITTATAGDLVVPQRVGLIQPAQQRLTVRDLLNWGRTTSNSIEFVRETGFTNNANVVSENPVNGKPQSDLTFELDSAPVATIAHWVHASRQILSDAGMLQSYIDGRLRYGLALKEEAQLLKGSGTGLNINGIHTQASSYVRPSGATVANETPVDRLRLAMLQVALAEYAADGIVLNPIDWASIELLKTTDQGYLFANPQAVASPTLWGLPVVATQSMDQGDFLTGSFQLGAQGWDRENATVTISTEDRDNFIKNMVTILCEERIALTVYRPEAFVKGELSGS